MTDLKPGRGSDQFPLRLPEGMRDRIKDEAAKSGRSMNAEIVHRLANSLDFPKFEDAGLDFDEELNFSLMTAAGYSGRSLMDEVVYRLKQSLAPETTIINELERSAWSAQRRLDDIMRLFIQLTPEERRLLEERAEIMDFSKKSSLYPKLSSKQIGEFVRLNPIGKKGHMVLTRPSSDYSAILPPRDDE
ncbi:Arc family DNA-binding protein [Rhizobium sp. 11_C7_N12_5]|uniref:Arc family DNA-binding protein n=1 Tax=Rhizobium sp. 11_C7_N12_5 TaxID=3240770 RepID=UPI003F2432A3